MLILEHHIQVNQGQSTLMTAEQLWTGLTLRVCEPTRFTVGLDAADVEQIAPNKYRRVLYFGAHQIADEVTLEANTRVSFVTQATDTIPAGGLVYEIQTTDTALGLRLYCAYHTQFPEPQTTEDEQVLETIKNAYRMADDAMLTIIRQDIRQARH